MSTSVVSAAADSVSYSDAWTAFRVAGDARPPLSCTRCSTTGARAAGDAGDARPRPSVV
ncbi:MAG: hypothetical protein ACODAF_08300 [Actinomycetota bacterium]